MHMSSAFPGGRPPDQPGEYVGEYKGMDWMNAPGEGKIHDVVREEGGGMANFVKSRMVTKGMSRGFISKRVL